SRIELDDDLDPDLALGGDQQGPNVFGEAKQLGGLVKIKAGGLEGLHRQVNPRITDQWGSATGGDACPDPNGPPPPLAMVLAASPPQGENRRQSDGRD